MPCHEVSIKSCFNAISQLLFENFSRRKSLTGNWKTNVGQSILEEVPVQVNNFVATTTQAQVLRTLFRYLIIYRTDIAPGLTLWRKCLGDSTSAPWRLWWPGTGLRSSSRSTTAPWVFWGKARRRTGAILPR